MFSYIFPCLHRLLLIDGENDRSSNFKEIPFCLLRDSFSSGGRAMNPATVQLTHQNDVNY